MVRNYVRKSNRAKTYTPEDLATALAEVKSGRKTVYGASKHFKIPLNTIIDHIKGRRGKKSKSMGRSTVLSQEVEEILVKGLKQMEQYGYGLSRKEILEIVGEYVRQNQIKTPFRDGTPAEDWFLGFKKRHKLSIKKPRAVEFARKKSCDPFIIDEYFKKLKQCLIDLKLEYKPSMVWNIDETSFSIDPSKTKVVGAVNSPSTRTTSTPGKENITVVLGCNAGGGKAPPLIIFKGKNIWDQWTAPQGTGYPGTTYAATNNGWMESEVFENYFEKSLIPAFGEERPVLLIFDGHKTHVGINVIKIALQNNITILKLPPHSSHLLQPLDLSVNKSFKSTWDEKLVRWQRLHVGTKLPKQEFSKLVGQVWMELSPNVIKSGFRKGGIFPFNQNVIPEETYDPLALKRFKKINDQTSADNENVLNNPNESLGNVSDLSFTESLISSQDHSNATNSNSDLLHPSTSKELDKPETGGSFVELLLARVKSAPTQTLKKKKIALGAEVITSEEVLNRMQTEESQNKLREKEKEDKRRDRLEKDKQKNIKKKKVSFNKKKDMLKGRKRS